MEHLAACPLCQEFRRSHYTSCKDYTVSHETFILEQCEKCGFVFTNPRPEEEELAHYYQSETYISHSDASKTALDSVYKIARTFTLKWKYELVLKHSLLKPATILDYGCGTGAFLDMCQKKGLKIGGVEPADNARLKAEALTGRAIAKHISEVKGTFHVITLWHVLEHVTALHDTVAELHQSLDEKGTMFIAVPNLKSGDARHYQNHWAAYDVPRHLWHFSKDSMHSLLLQHNLRIEEILPMPLDAYYVCLLSEKYKTQKQNLVTMATAAKQAWKANQSAKQTGEYSSLIYIVRK